MKQQAYVAGVGMTHFGKHIDTPLKALATEAMLLALQDAGLEIDALQAAYMANAAGGLIVGQEMIPGQVALRNMGVGGIPVVNIENACASASTAFNQASAMITAGFYDVVMVCGFEKLYHEDKRRTFAAFSSAVDVEDPAGLQQMLTASCDSMGIEAPSGNAGDKRSAFMDIYAVVARYHMQRYGTTQAQLAAVSAKNSFHGSLNPNAQFREVLSVEVVLAQREVFYPLTLPMCSPIGDGAAAVILVSKRKALELGLQNAVRVVSSVLGSGLDQSLNEPNLAERCVQTVYEEEGLGPADLSCVELHDASAPSELMTYEYLGLCAKGESGALVESGATRLGGRIPVNTSGGLLRKGHPVGATGAAQIVELSLQLQGRAGKRQVEGATVGLAHNAGGSLGLDTAATVVSLLARENLS